MRLEKTQADAIVQAILEPDLRVQEELREKCELESLQVARQRQVAGLSLAGSGTGAAIAHFSGINFSIGVIRGGLAGAAIGWLLKRQAAA